MTLSPGFRSANRTCCWRRPASCLTSEPSIHRSALGAIDRQKLGWRARWMPFRELQVCLQGGAAAEIELWPLPAPGSLRQKTTSVPTLPPFWMQPQKLRATSTSQKPPWTRHPSPVPRTQRQEEAGSPSWPTKPRPASGQLSLAFWTQEILRIPSLGQMGRICRSSAMTGNWWGGGRRAQVYQAGVRRGPQTRTLVERLSLKGLSI